MVLVFFEVQAPCLFFCTINRIIPGRAPDCHCVHNGRRGLGRRTAPTVSCLRAIDAFDGGILVGDRLREAIPTASSAFRVRTSIVGPACFESDRASLFWARPDQPGLCHICSPNMVCLKVFILKLACLEPGLRTGQALPFAGSQTLCASSFRTVAYSTRAIRPCLCVWRPFE